MAGRPRHTRCPWPEKVLAASGPIQTFRGIRDRVQGAYVRERTCREIRDQVRSTHVREGTFPRYPWPSPEHEHVRERTFRGVVTARGIRFGVRWCGFRARMTIRITSHSQRGKTATRCNCDTAIVISSRDKRLPLQREAVRCPAIKDSERVYQRVPAFSAKEFKFGRWFFPEFLRCAEHFRMRWRRLLLKSDILPFRPHAFVACSF